MKATNSFKLVVSMAIMATLGLAQITFDPVTGDLHCPETGGSFCVGNSLVTSVIADCSGNGKINLHDCNEVLADLEPSGEKDDASCYQVSLSAGNATCYWHGTLYTPSPVSITMTLDQVVVNQVQTPAPHPEAEDDNDIEGIMFGDDDCISPEVIMATSSVTATLDAHTVIEVGTTTATNDVSRTEATGIEGVTQYPAIVEIASETASETDSQTESASDSGRDIVVPTVTHTIISIPVPDTLSVPSHVNDLGPSTTGNSRNVTWPFHRLNNTVASAINSRPANASMTSFETSTLATGVPYKPETSTVIVFVGGPSDIPTASINGTHYVPHDNASIRNESNFALIVLSLLVLAML